MLGDCSLFLCFRGRKSETVDGNSYLDPVLLVSGIGGSILHSNDKRFGFQSRVWVQIFVANLEFKKKLWPIYNPKTCYTKSLDDNTEIVVPEDDYGLYAIDILDPSLLVECPSIYEMLPNPQFKWKKQPQIRVWQKESEGKETSSVKLESCGPTESVVLFEEALRNNELTYDKKAIALPFNFSILRWAAGTRQILNNSQLPNGVSFYNIFGTSFDTPIDVWYVTKPHHPFAILMSGQEGLPAC
ncbi:hypothetical protein HHK36_028458 [Tetracentron sinense]|uniref:Uncharacterized protein n=1 Tax=Tetracentron sinense TaxID=13715 RepID=A0A835D2L8_TETSI|nr:hypothetical protein HHK36_028458 [Tetracentron sinense]